MIWPFSKCKHRTQAEQDRREALAAKIQAEVDDKAANETLREVSEQTGQLRTIYARNHFSESLTKAFREGHA